MKIYTKKGDSGQTYLFGGGPLPKDDKRVEAYGNIDELNSVVGAAVAGLGEKDPLRANLLEVQKQLFVVGTELSALSPDPKMTAGFIRQEHIETLEGQIDAWETELEPLKNFILPGGHPSASFLHQARTVCRRAERSLVALSRGLSLRPELLIYLNRLSDWFFVLARVVNRRAGFPDLLWEGILKS